MTTETIVAPNKTDSYHLKFVAAEMELLGSPTIAAYWDGEKYIALEGSHRIAAASSLGLPVSVSIYEEGDDFEHDFSDVAEQTVSAVLDYLSDSADRDYYELEVTEV